MSYKYRPIPEDVNPIFLEVIKPLYWHNRAEDNPELYGMIPVGSITWMKNAHCLYKVVDGLPVLLVGPQATYGIIPEDNRYFCNFDPSCFKILHTSKQKIRR